MATGFRSAGHKSAPRPDDSAKNMGRNVGEPEPIVQKGTPANPEIPADRRGAEPSRPATQPLAPNGNTAPEPEPAQPAEPQPSAEPSTPAPASPAKPSTENPASTGRHSTNTIGRHSTPAPTPGAGAKPSPAPGLSAGTTGTDASAATGGFGGGMRDRLGNFARAGIGYGRRNRKGLLFGGGITAFLLALFLSFIALLPLKLETMIKSIMDHETARMTDYVTRRADVTLFRFVYEKVTGNVASNAAYQGNTIIKTLWGNMRLSQFENKLAEKGIHLSKGASPNSINITVDGEPGTTTLKSADELANFFNTDLKGKQARVAIKELVNNTYKPIQFLKRRHLRKYVRNAYNIRRWNIPKQEDEKAANPDLPSSTIRDVQANEVDPSEEMSVASIDCAVGDGPCPNEDTRKSPDGSSEMHPSVNTPDRASETAAGDTTKQGLRDSYKELKTATTKAITSGLEKIFGEAVTKALFKAVPVVGWLALAADVDNFFWSGHLRDIGIMLHSVQYAGVAMTWSSLADQAKAGELTASQLNVLNNSLDSVEQSNAVQRIFFNSPNSGVTIPDDKRVGSDTLSTVPNGQWGYCDFMYTSGLTPPSGASSSDFLTWMYRKGVTMPQNVHTPLCVLHDLLKPVSDFISSILGPPLNAVLQAVIDTINKVASGLTHTNVDIMQIAQDSLKWLVNTIWTPVATGRETGPDLGNAIDAGWDVTANQMCRDVLGCQNISNQVAYDQQTQIAADNRAEVSSRGLLAGLFSTDNPQSLGSKAIALLPNTPQGALNSVQTAASSLLANPLKLFGNFFSSAHAATSPAREPNGVQQTGYSDAQLDDPTLHVATKDIAGPPGPDGKPTGPDGRIDEFDCPVITDANQPNQCLIDTAAAQDLCAGSDGSDDGGLGGNGDPGPCGDPTLKDAPPPPTPTPLASPAAFAPSKSSGWFSFLHWSLP